MTDETELDGQIVGKITKMLNHPDIEVRGAASIWAVEHSGLERALAEVERLRASQERLKSAIEFAHADGFQWPSDPMAEFS